MIFFILFYLVHFVVFFNIENKLAFLQPRSEELIGISRGERDGKRAETRFRLSQKRTSPFKSVGTSVLSTAGSRGLRISLSNVG